MTLLRVIALSLAWLMQLPAASATLAAFTQQEKTVCEMSCCKWQSSADQAMPACGCVDKPSVPVPPAPFQHQTSGVRELLPQVVWQSLPGTWLPTLTMTAPSEVPFSMESRRVKIPPPVKLTVLICSFLT